ncbi:hypothetical protein PYW08_008601 [Mythimna loreyi]|uniref:Uncharacterized protein n=1 Tax=Mythimna loreyi TaxID=667449 RepID=A0ACC2Q960_9NEOP|nr:hypothetical protein PYW08_008601 [Mythimna loreyi]
MESRGGCAGTALAREQDGALRRAGRAVSLWRVFCGAGVWERGGRWGCRDCDATSARRHNASRQDAQLCFTIRDAMRLTYARTSHGNDVSARILLEMHEIDK